MKKYGKRLLALLLACIMVLACVVTAFASDGIDVVDKVQTLAPETWTRTLDFSGDEFGYYYVSKVTIPCKGTLRISMVSSDGSAYPDEYDSPGGTVKEGLFLYKTKPSISEDTKYYKVFGFGGKAKATHEVTLTKGTYYLASDLGIKFKYTFTPVQTAVSSAKNTSSKAVTVKWKKVSGVTGYPIQYSTNSNFSSKKTVTVKKASTVSTKSRV